MPGQSNISNLLSLNPKASPARPRPAAEGDGFRQVFEGAAPHSRSARSEPSSQAALRSRSEPRSESSRPSEDRPGVESRSPRTTEARGTESTRANERPVSNHPKEAESSRQSEKNPGSEGTARAETSAVRSEQGETEEAQSANAEAVLAALSEEDWSALSEDVTALLGELKAAVDGGELTPELEEALRQLLADLESGVPLDQVAKSLEAIPMSALPELATQFPGAQTLRDALGRRGAAYLSQLGALARQGSSGAPTLEPGMILSGSASADEGPGRLELASLLELSVSAGKNGKEAFAQTLQALSEGAAKAAARVSTSFEGGQSPANALAQMDGNNRSQPLTPTERGFTVQTDVRVPVNQGQWGQAVGQKVLWMASQKLSSAELRLDPPDLGPMQVRVSSHQDQITVTFTSPQAAVREALDQNANRLREMFAEQGLDLVDVNVSDHSDQEQAAEDGEGRSGGRGGQSDGDDPESRVVEQRISDRLVDHYA